MIPQRITMSKRIQLFLVLLTLVLIISCRTQDTANPDKVILKIGTVKQGLKSANILSDYFVNLFAQLSNPPLMKINREGRPQGLIAKEFKISDDKTIWTFFLDDNLFWSDGRKVTALDAKFSVELYAKQVPFAAWLDQALVRVQVSGDNALVLRLNRPYARLHFDFASYSLFPMHVWENIKNPLEYTNPGEYIGCGPFTIEKIDLNAAKISFKRNPHWQGGEPFIDGIEVHFYNNMDILSLALEKGEVDTFYRYASSYPYANIDRLKATGRFDFIQEQNLGLKFLGFNLNKKPMSDVNFREALSYALDYEEIIKLDALGYGEVSQRGFIPRGMSGYKKTQKLEYDIDIAKKILHGSGYQDKNGNGILESHEGEDIQLLLLISPLYTRISELIRDYLLDIGLDARLKIVDENTWISLKNQYQYDLVVSRTTPWGMLMHANWATGYFDVRRTGEGVLHNVDDPEFLKLCDSILATTDETELRVYAQKVQDYYAQNLPAIPLGWTRIVIPYHKNYTGWISSPLYGIFNIDNFLSIKPSTS